MRDAGELILETRMKVSDLSAPPAGMFWRVNFAANAPGPVADRGDQFYLLAATDGLTPSFTFGTAVRDTNGELAYTPRGTALSGELDSANDEVVMRLAFSALDPYVTHGPVVGPGSVLVGLRGHTGTLQQGTTRDLTRGGGSIVVCNGLLGVGEDAERIELGLGKPTPNPAQGGVSAPIYLSHSAWVDVGVFDTGGRRVRTVHAGVVPAGTTRLRWDARTDAGHRAASGIYFFRMLAGGRTRSQRAVLVH